MKYYVRRFQDDSCRACKEWEQVSFDEGGILFGKEDLLRAFSAGGRTNLFHVHCRCTLTAAPRGRPITDETDYQVILKGTIAEITARNNPEPFSTDGFVQQLSVFYKRVKNMVRK